ncbi:glutathione S-transferase family protein [Hansschlegelia quercus]|uniref:Glutathione S-transferase family protein n=1 Tax=Hansschlegelia quercus TaxID=2528245 RepID=A0A4Q9GH87_9HYPH|nr:glutathione S-transferase family protein [Hansschlegelia quercus]TBN53338.1 glutathione S-transferase family protein [Hansschlegelia quercus]
MPVNPSAPIEITAFDWVPDFAKGLVRDIRARWALEEAGLPYAERLFDARRRRPAEYFSEQPFGQVPAFRDGDVSMFESGAIVLHVAEGSAALMPQDADGRARALCWLFAALNNVEPLVMELATVDVFARGEDWATLRRPSLVAAIEAKLGCVSDALGPKAHLAGRFTVADIVMTTVLRGLRHTDLVSRIDNLAAYVARCEARPAFQRALADQLAAFEPQPSVQ